MPRDTADALAPFIELVADRVFERLTPSSGDREPWLKLARAAEYADCSPDTIVRAIKGGRLEGGKAGDDWRTRRSYIDAWIVTERPAPPARSDATAGDLTPCALGILGAVNGGKR